MRKKIGVGSIAVAMLAFLFLTGCSENTLSDKRTDQISAVATIGMIADVVGIIGGEHVAVHGLMGPGVDPHLYKATPSDVLALQKADIIFYNGLHLESKMGTLFEKMGQTRMTVAVTKNIPESGLLSPEEFEGLHDPHVWFDVTLWKYTVKDIAEALAEKDAEHADFFEANATRYLAELDQLNEYVTEQALRVPQGQRMLVTAHDAFNYFGRRYGFEVTGLQGISTEAQAGTRDVQKLVNLIVDRKIKAIFVESSVPVKNIKAVQEAVKAKGWNVVVGGELFSDAMGDAGSFEGTYVGMITHNIDTIVSALLGAGEHED
jgi:manganese/zinc/iron transport system substrate-binding protein